MVGAIDFMHKWYDECHELKSCDYCRLRDVCRGSMARLNPPDILQLVSLVMGKKGGTNEKAGYNKS